MQGNATDLQPLVSQPESHAVAVSDAGYVVGNSDDPNANSTNRGFLCSASGGFYYLPASGLENVTANDVNNAGQVVGFAGDSGYLGPYQALQWNLGSSTPQVLETPSDCYNAQALSINNAGVCVGTASPGLWDQDRAVVWDANGHVTELPCLPGDIAAEAVGINDQGQIVGWSVDSGYDDRAVIWDPVPEQPGEITLLSGLASMVFRVCSPSLVR